MIKKERRLYPRISYKSPLHYRVRGYPVFDDAISDNISGGGIGFISEKFIAPSTILMLELGVLSRTLKPVAEVVSSIAVAHSDRNRLGLKFLEMEDEEKSYLENFIKMKTGQL